MMLRVTRIPPDEETVKAAGRDYTGDTDCRFTVTDGETRHCDVTDGETVCRFTMTVNRQFANYLNLTTVKHRKALVWHRGLVDWSTNKLVDD